MGIVGIETAFSLLYTYLVKKGVITLEKLIELMSTNPAKRFGFNSSLEEGECADFTVFDLESKYTINPDGFVSMGKATPFEGYEVYGECLMTVRNGEIVWRKGDGK